MRSPLDWSVDRTRRTDAMFVMEPTPGYARRVLLLDVLAFLMALICWGLVSQLHGWERTVAAVVIGLQLGRAGITSFRRASAYRSGWLRGRSQMVGAMIEARNRGMSPSDWLAGELARDYSVLGITEADLPPPPPTQE